MSMSGNQRPLIDITLLFGYNFIYGELYLLKILKRLAHSGLGAFVFSDQRNNKGPMKLASFLQIPPTRLGLATFGFVFSNRPKVSRPSLNLGFVFSNPSSRTPLFRNSPCLRFRFAKLASKRIPYPKLGSFSQIAAPPLSQSPGNIYRPDLVWSATIKP